MRETCLSGERSGVGQKRYLELGPRNTALQVVGHRVRLASLPAQPDLDRVSAAKPEGGRSRGVTEERAAGPRPPRVGKHVNMRWERALEGRSFSRSSSRLGEETAERESEHSPHTHTRWEGTGAREVTRARWGPLSPSAAAALWHRLLLCFGKLMLNSGSF